MPTAQSFRQIVGIAPSTVSAKDSTLIIIDAQNEYAEGKLKVENIAESRKVIADLLARYRAAGTGKNIVHIIHETPQGAPVFTPGTSLAEELEELKPQGSEAVITKVWPSSFAQTSLHDYLQTLGDVGKQIVLVGYMAHVCISTTARAGHELGYDVVVVKDAVGDRYIPAVDAATLVDVALAEVADFFGTVLSSSAVRG